MSFEKAFNKVVFEEGGYVNDKDDRGGETFMGISRKFHHSSKMWDIVDEYKKDGMRNITKRLKGDTRIINEVKRIYKRDYWDKLRLDEVNDFKLSYQIFDHGVNAGVPAAVRLAQYIVSENPNGVMTDDLIDKLNNYKHNGK